MHAPDLRVDKIKKSNYYYAVIITSDSLFTAVFQISLHSVKAVLAIDETVVVRSIIDTTSVI